MILSHTWGEEELSFPDLQNVKSNESSELEKSKGYRKIKDRCKFAASDVGQHQYIWIDTCCIDKTSSAELSETINPMYRCYEEAEVCYAYLEDVGSAGRSDSSLIRRIERR